MNIKSRDILAQGGFGRDGSRFQADFILYRVRPWRLAYRAHKGRSGTLRTLTVGPISLCWHI